MSYRLLFAVTGVVAALAISGCQDQKGSASGGSSAEKPATSPAQTPSPSGSPSGKPTDPDSEAHPPDAKPAKANLTISLKKGASSSPQSWTLTCDPPGGNHPKAKAACAALAKAEAPFAPARKSPCTFIYGGPETATVTGTWRGQQVNTTFSRKNGCELDRWTKAGDLLPEVPRVR
jgi:Subtilisin inhibitor-like